jgi:hypothetical protein
VDTCSFLIFHLSLFVAKRFATVELVNQQTRSQTALLS